MPANNTIHVIGRVGTDPESRVTDRGKASAKFRLAVTRPGKDKDGNSATDWFTVEMWGRAADVAMEYVTKGAMVAVTGACQIDEWTDRDGNKQRLTKIVGDSLYLCGDRQDRPPREPDRPPERGQQTMPGVDRSKAEQRAKDAGRWQGQQDDFDDDIPPF